MSDNNIDVLTQHGYRMTAALDDEATAGLRMRQNRRVVDVLETTRRENERLLRERHILRREHERAVALVRQLVDRSEAFRRLVNHLRQTWHPDDPADLALKGSLKPLLEAKKQELAAEPGWAESRDAGIEAHLRAEKDGKAPPSKG